MSIGVALVIIFVLYLIDKHNQWRRAAHVTGGVVVLAVVVLGGWLGWNKYQDWKADKDRQRVEAEQAKQDAPMKNCIASKLPAKHDVFDEVSAEEECKKIVDPSSEKTLAQVCAEWEAKHPLGSPIDVLHGKWDDGTLMPKEGVTLGSPQGCSGPLEDAYNSKMAVKRVSSSIECFDKKTGKKEKDFAAQFGGVTTSCGPNFIQRPAGQCTKITAPSDPSHEANCTSDSVIDLSAGLVPK
jgi:hypothetical protein